VDNGFDVSGGGQPLVVTEKNGTWGKALILPGSRALARGTGQRVDSAVDAGIHH